MAQRVQRPLPQGLSGLESQVSGRILKTPATSRRRSTKVNFLKDILEDKWISLSDSILSRGNQAHTVPSCTVGCSTSFDRVFKPTIHTVPYPSPILFPRSNPQIPILSRRQQQIWAAFERMRHQTRRRRPLFLFNLRHRTLIPAVTSPLMDAIDVIAQRLPKPRV